MKKIIVLISFSLFLLFSCEEAWLGEDEDNSPQNSFELFWSDFDEHYGLFTARNLNWDSIYQVYQPQVSSATTDAELWNIFKAMVSYLDDSHTALNDPENGIEFESGSEQNERVKSEFSLDLVKNKYLENLIELPLTDPEEPHLYGKMINHDIGYFYLGGIEFDKHRIFDDILDDIGGYGALIIDIRNNLGGDDQTAAALAGRFADKEELVYTVQERNGPNHNDFSDKIEYRTSKKGRNHFNKPVVILTDRITVSGAEVFTLHMKAFDQVTQIGDTTAGDFSDIGMLRFLPNDWTYSYSIMMFLLPDGSSLDGLGHVPDIQIRNSASDIENGNDLVLERAVEFLNGN